MSGIDPTPEPSQTSASDLEFFTQDQAGDAALRKLGRQPGPDGKWSNEDCVWLPNEMERHGLVWFFSFLSGYPVKEGPQRSRDEIRDELEKLPPPWERVAKALQRKALLAALLKARADL